MSGREEKAAPTSTRRQGRPTIGAVVTGIIGTVTGLAPHVLHHVGPLLGVAAAAGAGGTALFGVLGLVASIPMLLRLKRRFGSWWAPLVALTVFAGMFAFSTFVVGPWLTSVLAPQAPAVAAPSTFSTPGAEHSAHHTR